MSWIKGWAKGSFSLFSGNVIDAFQPLDFFHYYGLWYDLWIKRSLNVFEKLGAEKKSYTELKHLLSTPSNMRAVIQKTIPAYLGTKNADTKDYARFFNFLARMLSECCPSDAFGETSTPLHTTAEVEEMLAKTPWQEGSPKIAKKIGQLITSAGSLVHGLYNDVVTDFGWDAYGPYAVDGTSLLIRHFPDMRPKELWEEKFLASYKDIKIYGLYEGVEWQIGCVGCHTIVKNGKPIEGLKKYAVVADGKLLNEKEIEELISELANKAEGIHKEIRKKDFEQLKEMVMLQECYQLKKFFDAAGMDWRPTEEMLMRVRGKELLKGILPHGKMMTSVEMYIEDFGLRKFAKEVLNEEI